MNKERISLIMKIAGGVALACLIFFVFIKACGPDEPQVSDPNISQPPSDNGNAVIGEDNNNLDKPNDYDFIDEIEDAGRVSVQDGKYDNSVELSLAYNKKGDTIKVGLGDGSMSEQLLLNIQCSVATAETPVGFYVMANGGFVEYSEIAIPYRNDIEGESNDGNLLLGRTYDKAMHSTYIDETMFGCRWSTETTEGATLSIRAINLDEMRYGQLLTICKVDVVYDKVLDQYRLDNLRLADVKYDKEISLEERDAIVSDAVDFMRNAERNYRAYDASDRSDEESLWSSAEIAAIVEKVPMTYFTKLYDIEGSPLNRRDYMNRELYAVSYPLTTYGFVTIYYIPELQLLGMSSPYAPGSTDLNLTILGYDAFYPFNENTLDDAAFNYS